MASKTITKRKPPYKEFFSKITVQLGRVGKSLVYPVAVLPIAAILLRLGGQLPGDTAFAGFVQKLFQNGGNVVFDNLPILFAIGVGFGLTKDNRGEAALVAFIGMTLLAMLMKSNAGDLTSIIYQNSSVDFHEIFGDKYDAILANNVLNGFISGALVAYVYNRYNGVQLPTALGFFSGRRLLPVITILGMLFFGIAYSIIFPWIGYVLYLFSDLLGQGQGNRFANAGIMLVYGIINRLLIPFGMHQIPNTLFWFTLGDHVDALGNPVYGDINIFLTGVAKDNTAGTFQSGFFPIMMFGLPALVGAFYVTAEDKEQKQRVLGLFGSAALISFLSGITEPIEFAFLFTSPLLFGMHAILTGIFGFITGLFGIQLGFGFSAGLLDLMLSIPKSLEIIAANKTGIDAVMANPGWIFVIGALAAATYFFLGRFLIKKLNLQTPGRGTGKIEGMAVKTESTTTNAQQSFSNKAKYFVKALGGWNNLVNLQTCATRLRYDLKDTSIVNEAALKKAGAMGLIKVSSKHVQVIVGPTAELLNNEIMANKGKSLDVDKPKAKSDTTKKNNA